MRLNGIQNLLLAVVAARAVDAHTAFTNFFVDGAPQGDGTCVRMSNINKEATNPIDGITSDDMACGVNGQNGVARVCSAKAGSKLTFEFRFWPDNTVKGALDPNHKGPCAVYMKKVESATTDKAVGGGWFNIYKDDYDSNAGKWCTEKIIDNNGHLTVTVPDDLEPGAYLVRPELLALHQANKTPADPQFYVGCAQIFLTSGGSAKPKDTVSIPGYVDMSHPAMTYNIWVALKLPFPAFGPPTYSSKSSKRDLSARGTLTQTEGLEPAHCLIPNSNWCGCELPGFSDEAGCYEASQNCNDQLRTCYDTSDPTGDTGCKHWESYCEDVQGRCQSGNFDGPPSAEPYMLPKLPMLSDSKSSASPPVSEGGDYTPDPEVSASSTPDNPSPKQSNEGSINTCGSNGGLTCKTGMCCSSHGYCGTSDDYCGSGCQSAFGTCSGAKYRRDHKRHGHPHMR